LTSVATLRVSLLVLALISLNALAAEPEAHEHAAEAHESAEHEAEEPVLEYSVDLAFGMATIDTVSNGVTGSSRAWSTSLLLGAEHPTPHATFGVRLPIVTGGLTALDGDLASRFAGVALGNLELEATHHTELMHGLDFEFTIELALPTSTGIEAPKESAGPVDEAAVARGDILRAAEQIRGSQDSALFEPGRVGFVPKVGLNWHTGNWHVRAVAKLEVLADVRGTAEEPLITEFVATARVGYDIAHLVEPFLHVWTNLSFVGVSRDMVVLEPGVRLTNLGHLHPSLSAIVPVYGPLIGEQAFGVRAMLTGSF
jgi:hypothetical protein